MIEIDDAAMPVSDRRKLAESELASTARVREFAPQGFQPETQSEKLARALLSADAEVQQLRQERDEWKATAEVLEEDTAAFSDEVLRLREALEKIHTSDIAAIHRVLEDGLRAALARADLARANNPSKVESCTCLRYVDGLGEDTGRFHRDSTCPVHSP